MAKNRMAYIIYNITVSDFAFIKQKKRNNGQLKCDLTKSIGIHWIQKMIKGHII